MSMRNLGVCGMGPKCLMNADGLRLLEGTLGVRSPGDADPVVERPHGTDDERGRTQFSETRQSAPDDPFNDEGEGGAPGDDIDSYGDRDPGDGTDVDN